MEAIGIAEWIKEFGQIGAAGLVAWLVWYYNTVTWPKTLDKMESMSDKHNETIKAVTDKQNATIEKVCTEFEQSVKDERESRRQDIAEMRAVFRCDASHK